MELATPIALGGTYYLTAVSVGRDPDDATVWDCPVCGDLGFADRWHLVATVRDVDSGSHSTYRYCSDECLAGWLRSVPELQE